MISLEKLKILIPLQKLPKNVGDLDKLIIAKCFEKLPKTNKSPNLVPLLGDDELFLRHQIVSRLFPLSIFFSFY